MKKINKNTSLVVVGGDGRMRKTAQLLANSGIKVTDLPCPQLCNKQLDGDYIVLPLPLTIDGVHLLCQDKSKIDLADIIQKLPPTSKILAGCVSERNGDAFEQRGFTFADYYTDEKLLLFNARLTAEATLQIVMQNTEKSIKDMNVLVVGCGRCGKATAKIFKKMGARVTLTSRRFKDKIKTIMMGVKCGKTARLADLVPFADVAINTVAHPLFTCNVLKDIPKKTLLVELASSAAGIDMQAAKEFGTNLIYAPGLPGKCLPDSAAEAIAQAVEKIIKEDSL